jgi:predicted nucleic acid-binding protein
VILLDTSVLVDALCGPRRSAAALRSAIERGHRIHLPSLVVYEWLRGPRLAEELVAQEALFPVSAAVPFGAGEAARAAELYALASRPRGREIDIALAAMALERDASIWTLNQRDFADLPGVELYQG